LLGACTRRTELLDGVFSTFDRLADEHGVEKIKTIGDAYKVEGGIPVARPDHCEAVADMALAMPRECDGRRAGANGIRLRIGVDSGPVVAGVIGRRKFIYDLWGTPSTRRAGWRATACRGRSR
jgi:adenylate cyclase